LKIPRLASAWKTASSLSATPPEETKMSEQHFLPGWDEDRVKRLIAHYESLTEEEQVAEDEAAVSEQVGQAVITVPEALLPAIRQLLAEASRGS
jgi:hypothetical protein